MDLPDRPSVDDLNFLTRAVGDVCAGWINRQEGATHDVWLFAVLALCRAAGNHAAELSRHTEITGPDGKLGLHTLCMEAFADAFQAWFDDPEPVQ